MGRAQLPCSYDRGGATTGRRSHATTTPQHHDTTTPGTRRPPREQEEDLCPAVRPGGPGKSHTALRVRHARHEGVLRYLGRGCFTEAFTTSTSNPHAVPMRDGGYRTATTAGTPHPISVVLKTVYF